MKTKTMEEKKTFAQVVRDICDHEITQYAVGISAVIALIGLIAVLFVPAVSNSLFAVYFITFFSLAVIVVDYTYVFLRMHYEHEEKMEGATQSVEYLSKIYGSTITSFTKKKQVVEFANSEMEKIQYQLSTIHAQRIAEVEMSEETEKELRITRNILLKQMHYLSEMEYLAKYVIKVTAR